MKVIVASMPKCGTKTLAACLHELGYTVHDVFDQMQHNQADWERIFDGDATTEDIRRMYKDVDAVTDMPACGLWEELSRAFPEAKVLRDLNIFAISSANQHYFVSSSYKPSKHLI